FSVSLQLHSRGARISTNVQLHFKMDHVADECHVIGDQVAETQVALRPVPAQTDDKQWNRFAAGELRGFAQRLAVGHDAVTKHDDGGGGATALALDHIAKTVA